MNMDDLLQVWFRGQIVGYLNARGEAYADRDHVILDIGTNRDLSKPFDELYLETAIRKHTITDLARLSHSDEAILDELLKHHVPPYALSQVDPLQYATVYYWRVVRIHESHFDLMERLFDHDSFIPIDEGPVDRDVPSRVNTAKISAETITGSKITHVWFDELLDMPENPELKAEIEAFTRPLVDRYRVASGAIYSHGFDPKERLLNVTNAIHPATRESKAADLAKHLDRAMLKTFFARS